MRIRRCVRTYATCNDSETAADDLSMTHRIPYSL
jgi:hypothetical protein